MVAPGAGDNVFTSRWGGDERHAAPTIVKILSERGDPEEMINARVVTENSPARLWPEIYVNEEREKEAYGDHLIDILAENLVFLGRERRRLEEIAEERQLTFPESVTLSVHTRQAESTISYLNSLLETPFEWDMEAAKAGVSGFEHGLQSAAIIGIFYPGHLSLQNVLMDAVVGEYLFLLLYATETYPFD